MRRANVWKKAACVALSLLYFLQIKPQVVQAADYWPEGPEVQSPSVILMEMSTGTVLYEKNSDERNYPASITKIMTTLLALENSDLNEVVTFSDDAINNTEGSGIYRDYGEQMTMEQCLYAVMLNSASVFRTRCRTFRCSHDRTHMSSPPGYLPPVSVLPALRLPLASVLPVPRCPAAFLHLPACLPVSASRRVQTSSGSWHSFPCQLP